MTWNIFFAPSKDREDDREMIILHINSSFQFHNWSWNYSCYLRNSIGSRYGQLVKIRRYSQLLGYVTYSITHYIYQRCLDIISSIKLGCYSPPLWFATNFITKRYNL